MNKKTATLVLMMMVLSMSVMAAGNGQQTASQTQEKEQTRSTVMGLENAMIRVGQDETKAHLESILERTRTMKQSHFEKLESLNNLIVEKNSMGQVIAKGEGEAKFLGLFRSRYQYMYQIDEATGEMTRQRHWYDFAFGQIEELPA
jgi:hypothetical protein